MLGRGCRYGTECLQLFLFLECDMMQILSIRQTSKIKIKKKFFLFYNNYFIL